MDVNAKQHSMIALQSKSLVTVWNSRTGNCMKFKGICALLLRQTFKNKGDKDSRGNDFSYGGI